MLAALAPFGTRCSVLEHLAVRGPPGFRHPGRAEWGFAGISTGDVEAAALRLLTH